MMVYSKMKTLGSGKVGKRAIPAASSAEAIKKAWFDDARLFIKVFGKEKAKMFLKDTIFSTEYLTA